MKSKTKIEKRRRKKTNPILAGAIINLKKTNTEFARELSKPRSCWKSFNLSELDNIYGDLLVAGKVLSGGQIRNAKKIVAWNASKKAIEKIKSVKGSFVCVVDEMKKNPELKNLKVVK